MLIPFDAHASTGGRGLTGADHDGALMTLGTYSIIPPIYLWREVSWKLAAALFGFFWALGFASVLLF